MSMQRTMNRRTSILGRLGLWGVTFGTLAAHLACAADVDLGTRGGAGQGSGADASSGGDGTSDASGAGGRVSAGGSPNGSGGSPTNGGGIATGSGGSSATSGNGGTSLGGTTPGAGGTQIAGTGALGGTGGVPENACSTRISATPTNNFSFASELTLNVTKVKPNSNVTFDWSNLTRDLVGQPVDPDSIDMLELALWDMSAEELRQSWPDIAWGWAQDNTGMLLPIGVFYPDGETRATLLDVKSYASAHESIPEETLLSYFDPVAYPPETHVYTLIAASGTEYGHGARMLGAFVLDEDSDEAELALASSSAHLDYSVDLRSLTPQQVPFGVSGLSIDYSYFASGGLFYSPQFTRLEVASYALSLADLEGAAFMSRDAIADGRWTAELAGGSRADLAQAVDADGVPFPGIDATHTWLVSLGCGDCDAPAPVYLSVLHTCNSCGDGVVQADLGEACDDGINAGEYGGCAPDCQLGPYCGDGVVQPEFGESCDEGSANGALGPCLVGCQLRPR